MSKANQKGSAVLEFAIGSAVMLSLFAGVFQFGFTFYRYNLLYNAVRNAAQYASMRSYDSSDSTPSSAYRTAVANIAVFGSPEGGSMPVVPGLTTDKVT